MKFLRTLFWVVVMVSLAIFAIGNWSDVSLSLWGNLQAEVKKPVLLLFVFLLGFLPPYFVMRSKLWTLRRRLAQAERANLPPLPAAPAFDDGPREEPA